MSFLSNNTNLFSVIELNNNLKLWRDKIIYMYACSNNIYIIKK